MKLTDVEAHYRALLLGADERLMPDASPVRQRVYRRLVRANLSGNIRRAVPITRKLIDDASLERLIVRFLDEVAPRTRLVRRIAVEWAEWLMTVAPSDLPHPAAAELAHWEVLEVEVSLASEWEGPGLSRVPADDAFVETHPSARLVAYWHPVHSLTQRSTMWPERSDEPIILLAWRAQERFLWQRLGGGTAKVLAEAAQGKQLGAAFTAVEAELAAGDRLDRPQVKASLVDLCRRGAIAGFSREHEPRT